MNNIEYIKVKDETKFSKVLPETIKNKEFNTANEAVEYIKHLDILTTRRRNC